MRERVLTSDNLHLSRVKNPEIIDKGACAIDCTRIVSEAVSDLVAASISENTRRAYRADLEHFTAWGGAIPAPAETVAAYLADHVDRLSVATLSRRLATLSKAHEARGLANPCHSQLVRATQGARNYQEDTALVWPGSDPFVPGSGASAQNGAGIVAVLADGMGGHAGGALASRMACENFVKTYAQYEGATRERLAASLEAANEAIAKTVSSNPLLSGMGSTLVGVVFSGNGVEWVSVGDSPLLLYRRGEIALLNEDHSLAPELDRMVAEGEISAEAARRDPRRHMLRSAVTGDDIDLVDFSGKPLAIEPGDYVILASDGLQTLEPSEIERVIAAYASDGSQAVANALIRAVEAMRDPHQDNTTVVAVRCAPTAPAA